MRVTANSFPTSLVEQLSVLANRQYRLQNQAATGQRIQAPDDDPAATQRVMDLQTESRRISQFQKNVSLLQEQASASFEVINQLKKISDRVGEIATLADGTKSPQDLAIYAKEVTQLIQQGVQLVNTQQRGRYLFGGTVTDQPPFTLQSDASNLPTGVAYQGNTGVAEVEIEPSLTFSVLTPGANTSSAGARGLVTDSRSGADFFAHLISLQNHLLAGDTQAIAATDRPALANDEENLISNLASNGAAQSRLATAAALGSRRAESVQGLVSKEADADLAQTMVHLNQTQYAYQAAIQSGAAIMSHSLLDFLR